MSVLEAKPIEIINKYQIICFPSVSWHKEKIYKFSKRSFTFQVLYDFFKLEYPKGPSVGIPGNNSKNYISGRTAKITLNSPPNVLFNLKKSLNPTVSEYNYILTIPLYI